MSLKDSKQFSNNFMPQLARFYMSHTQRVYGVKMFVGKKQYSRFSVFEDDLRDLHIEPLDYTVVVLTSYKDFVVSKAWKCLPQAIFLGDKALQRYIRTLDYTTVKLADIADDDIIFYDELTVARAFVERNRVSDHTVSLRQIVADLKPLLSDAWLQVYVNKKSQRPRIKILKQLVRDYKLPYANYDSYTAIVDMLR